MTARQLALATGLAMLSVPGLADATGSGPERIAGCQILPADNPFNQRVDTLPVAKDSPALIARARTPPVTGT